MTPNERAQHNHHELFPGHVSRLSVTDPELIEIFDNVAFDEVLAYGGLDKRTRLMVQLAALIASGVLPEYHVMVGAALTVGTIALGGGVTACLLVAFAWAVAGVRAARSGR